MNVCSMKLESRHAGIPNQQKSSDDSGAKKSRSPKKRVYGSTNDKDALVIPVNNGLGRQFHNSVDPKDPDPSCPKKDRFKKDNSESDMMHSQSDKIQEKLRAFLSYEDKGKIMGLLNEIRALSDVQKLYLYLQLPTGTPFDVDPFRQKLPNPLGKKADEEGTFAITWIQSHLEEDPDVSLPKQEVYDEYQAYCNMSGNDPLCAADFGKVMKQVFPSVKPRRLGTRGNSRYCYSGLRKKIKLEPPTLPDIQAHEEKFVEEKFGDEATAAASHLLLEWAEKLLGFHFGSLKELAAHLLENMYVDSRSVAAFTLWLESSPQYLTKGVVPEGNPKKSEAQFQLQRKIQEKELIKEQKKKLEEQRNSIIGTSKAKNMTPKKKTSKAKKAKIVNMEVAEPECDKNSEVSRQRNEESTLSQESLENMSDACIQQEAGVLSIKEEDCLIVCNSSEVKSIADCGSLTTNVVVSPLSSPQNSTPGELEDPNHASAKVFISQSSTPVCIAPTLPNIIIVPQLTSTPKYKRIQPKPLQGEIFSSVLRSRAGSVGSSLPSQPKAKNPEGRRSSFAWLQSDSGSSESGEEKQPRGSSDNLTAAFKSIHEKNKSFSALKDGVLYETPHRNFKSHPAEGFAHSPNGLSSILLEKRKQSSDSVGNLSSAQLTRNDEACPTKRQLEEKDDHADNKRIHLDSFKTASAWVPGTLKVSAALGTQLTNKVYTRISQEEVNVHEIEGDALNDYFQRGTNQNSILQSTDSQLSSVNKVQQLSQLRMLLEQNLPSAISKSAANSPKNQKSFKYNTMQDDSLNKSFLPIMQDNKLVPATDLFANQEESPNLAKNEQQINTLEDLLSSSCLVSDTKAHLEDDIVTDPSLFLNCEQKMEIGLPGEMNQSQSSLSLPSSLLTGSELLVKQENAAILGGQISTCIQVPSVPQSPNTRRRAFNFMPISPRHTPVPDGSRAVSSPHMRTMASVAVGPSQPPSNSGSPFVSPRSTPVPLTRSRHSSGQSTYSTSRHTPFQNFDSGVSSVSSSPFISPQPTPVPVSRLRHNSSNGGSNKTVTFSSVNSPQVIHTLNSVPALRTRHSSGPGATFMNFYSSQNSTLSPLVSDSLAAAFVFPPTNNETRSRHSSSSNQSPLSPVSELASSSSGCAANVNDLTGMCDSGGAASQSFINDGAGDLLISAIPTSFKQVRQRHASGSVLYNKSSAQRDIFSQEIQKLLKNYQESGSPDILVSNRSQSVPLHQMLQVTEGYNFLSHPMEDSSTKSHPSPPVSSQMFSFSGNQTLAVDSYSRDKTVVSQIDWVSLDGSDLEASSARRSLAPLYDASSPPPPPISDDLQTTLDDLRECDTVFSKLELELKQSEESAL